MQRKLKVTGFARFFLVMIIVAPIAYIGASYYNGEDGLANIKRFFGIEQRDESPAAPDVKDMDEKAMKQELEYQQKRLEELKKENERLRKEVYEKEQELSNLKAQ